jgi:hypothetical protein
MILLIGLRRDILSRTANIAVAAGSETQSHQRNSATEVTLAEIDETALGASAYSDCHCRSEETLRRIAPLVSGYGITRLARLADLDNLGMPV